MARRELDVYLELEGESLLAGQAWFTQRRGGPISSVFAYTPSSVVRVLKPPCLELMAR